MARNTGGRSKAALFLAVAAVAALIAGLVIFRTIRNFNETIAELEKPPETVKVVVAARQLGQGDTITLESLALKEIQPGFVPETVFFNPEDLVGRVPRERILLDEFIREERLADPEAGVGLNAIIPKGMRAVSINITDASAVSGFLNPGNYVDILVTLQAGGEPTQTVTLLQAVFVLAVDSRIGAGNRQEAAGYRPSVTLAVTPEQAEEVAHAQIYGAVTLTLRSDVDVSHVDTNGARTAKLIGTEEAPAVEIKKIREAPKKAEPTTLQIIRGGQIQRRTIK